MDLKGKVALITGAAQGIGKIITLLLAENGADIAICDINSKKLQETKKEIESLGKKCVAAKVNVASSKEAEQMAGQVMDEYKQIDILINNAGVIRDSFLIRMKEEDWDMVLNINLKGTFNFTKAVVKHMSKQKSGKIVNISSVVGVRGNIGQANYSASKAGIIGLTKTTALEFASRGINVNAVAPGFIDTDMTKSIPEKIKKEMKKQIPLDRLGTPQDIARVVYFLVSEASSYITGQIINVNGGMYM